MRIAVCEDNKDTCVALAGQVAHIMPEADVSVFLAGEDLISSKPDIVLLDVELGGMSGVEAARALRERGSDCAIIFVSGHEQYVFDAFDVDAVHYLLKPVDPLKLRYVLKKAAAQLEEKRGERWDRQIVVMSGGRRVRVRVETIRYAEVFNRTVVLHTTNGEVPYYGRLHTLLEQCGPSFCQTHRAYLVNLAFVDSYCASHAILGQDSVPISRKKYPEFVSKFTDYLRSRVRI